MDLTAFVESSAETITRLSSFLGQAMLFGLIPIFAFVLRPAIQVSSAENATTAERIGSKLERIGQAALGAAIAGVLGLVALHMASISELQGASLGLETLGSFAETSFGKWLLARLVMALALAILLVGKIRQGVTATEGSPITQPLRAWWFGWALLASGLLVTTSFAGHASVATPRYLSLCNDMLHLAAGATWLTGIVCLALVVPFAWKDLDESQRLGLFSTAVSRFSQVALVSIIVLSLTGILNCLLHVGRLSDLVATAYGRALLVKLLLFLPILVLGALNHLFLRRRLQRQSHAAERRATGVMLRRTIGAEVIIGLAVLAASATLTDLPRTKDSRAATETPAPARAREHNHSPADPQEEGGALRPGKVTGSGPARREVARAAPPVRRDQSSAEPSVPPRRAR